MTSDRSVDFFGQALEYSQMISLLPVDNVSPAKVKHWLNEEVAVFGKACSPSTKGEFLKDAVLRSTEQLSQGDDIYVNDNDTVTVAKVLNLNRKEGVFDLHFYQPRGDGRFDLKFKKNIYRDWDMGDFISVAERIEMGGPKGTRLHDSLVHFKPCGDTLSAGVKGIGSAGGRRTKIARKL
jgi:hypothetical protein